MSPIPRTDDEAGQYRTVKIPEWAYRNALEMRADLTHGGIQAVPARIAEPKVCPRCAHDVEHVTVGVEHVRCPHCSYTQQTLVAKANGGSGLTLGLGVLLGLGIAALLSETREPRPANGRRKSSSKPTTRDRAKRRS